jgi:hypothetical protein
MLRWTEKRDGDGKKKHDGYIASLLKGIVVL